MVDRAGAAIVRFRAIVSGEGPLGLFDLLDLFRWDDLAAGQQPAPPLGWSVIGGVARGHRPVVEPFTLRPRPHRAALPRRLGRLLDGHGEPEFGS